MDVLFQDKAWVNRECAEQWALQTLAPFCTELVKHGVEGELLLLHDNLDTQKQRKYKKALSMVTRTKSWFGAEDRTDLWQPVDQGFGWEVKREMGAVQETWLEDDDNLSLWEDGKLSASDRRILLTHWFAEAVAHVHETCSVTRCVVICDMFAVMYFE